VQKSTKIFFVVFGQQSSSLKWNSLLFFTCFYDIKLRLSLFGVEGRIFVNLFFLFTDLQNTISPKNSAKSFFSYSGEKNNSTISIHFLLRKIKLFLVFVFFQHKIFLYSLVFFLTKKCVSLFLNPAYKFIFKSFIKRTQKRAKKIAPLQHLLAKTPYFDE